ncbi:MAG: GNAT family N-acetyltransferase [Gammaproteobacteria bacterium]|nr:GNAT family N-acetyltransferase [Gammaproteobacteria bacterium]
MPVRFTVEEVCWKDAAEELSLVREKVFIAEQRLPRRLELDGRDCECRHVQARLDDGTVIGTGRMLPSGHIGHIAVLLPYRGKGVGKALLAKLVEIARQENQSSIYLDCPLADILFYESQHFAPAGRVFMEAGIPHRRMALALNNLGYGAFDARLMPAQFG